MKVGKLIFKDGKAVETEVKEIDQNKLSSECWMVQFHGLEYCATCRAKDTHECGGVNIRDTGYNKKGFKVPVK